MTVLSQTVQVPLYHGTSTLFLNDVQRLGLGGKDPLRELDLFAFVEELWPLAQAHLSSTDMFRARAGSFERMVKQQAGAWNFQHGQTYLSPSRRTVIGYAIRKRYGSELLTYALDFLQSLVDRDIPSVRTSLFQAYPKIFELLDTSPSPMLVRAANVPVASLLSESGGEPAAHLATIASVLADCGPDEAEDGLGQTNFRLSAPVPARLLTFWLINITRFHALDPKYTLHSLDASDSELKSVA